MSRRRRGLAVVVGVGILAVLTATLWPEAVDVAEVTVTDLALEVEVSGHLEAAESSLIGPPQIPGIYRFKISMMVPEGESVAAGDPVLGLDTTELQQKLRSLRAEVDEAEKQIERHRVDLEVRSNADELAMAEARARLRKARLKTDVPTELVSSLAGQEARLELELAVLDVDRLEDRIAASRRAGEARIAAVESRLERAQGDVAQAESAIAMMTRTAPRDGVVTYVTDWNNQKLKVGDSIHYRFSALEIPDLTSLRAAAEVEEALAGHLGPSGQAVELVLDAHPDHVFTGRVRDIKSSVQRKSWRNPLKVVRLDVDLDTIDGERMRPGMRFKGTVQTRLLREVVTIPVAAVFATPEGPVVWRRERWGWHRVEVDLGDRNRERVLVIDGLEPGERVSTVWRSS